MFNLMIDVHIMVVLATQTTTNYIKPFSRLNFCVYADMDKRERARARDKKKSKAETNFTKHENFKAVVKK